MRHDAANAEITERAALHALGALTQTEGRAFEEHLAEGCEVCAAELRAFESITGCLTYLSPAAAPGELRQRLLNRVRAEAQTPSPSPTPQVWRFWRAEAPKASMLILRSDEGGWEETSIPGISVRRLSIDPARRTVTMLVKMAPESSYPSHRHAGSEECYVLEGDLVVGEHQMRAGDYQRAEAGTVHEVQSTRQGCLLFILSSLHDEILTT
jgi:anti-sigma factor ChrR (cupin superfamily)